MQQAMNTRGMVAGWHWRGHHCRNTAARKRRRSGKVCRSYVDRGAGRASEADAMERFAKLVASRTSGEVEIKVFPNSQLGGELETAEGIRLGSIQFGAVTSSVLANWVPEVQVLICRSFFAAKNMR